MSGEGAQVITDEEWIRKVERYADLQEVGEEYEDLDAEIKKRFRGVEIGICGKTILEGKWQSNTTYPIPKEVKAQIDFLKEPYKKTEPKGKFFLTVTKV
jgi:hypothetical protein